ncbi:DNA alkylation repair protein [Aquirufa regiilacus]|uniref:DNA alkylation repair protein n=1 Tax=Aquirufa regiilacus TaxID=3024868 RepID=A0ABU3TNS9_9BACT|nr:DNA alkylation repair protein [Aquirufa sp. LEOWEIH-7C]MDU0807512.1 DNA alkylation repair protein [Aquirufa sp. LEOWEIH-7C]
MNFVFAIKEAFYALDNPENAYWMRWYMRDQYPFIGIKKPERGVVFKAIYKEYGRGEDWFEVCSKLFAMPEREFQYVAMEYMLKAKKSWDSRIPELIDRWVDEKTWWDVVDVLSPKVLSDYFILFPEQRDMWVARWMQSPIFWHQRLCILFQLNYKSQTDLELLRQVILSLNTSKEFFIQKAIGWALRQYARTDADWVRAFVEEHKLMPLSKREALKHIS